MFFLTHDEQIAAIIMAGAVVIGYVIGEGRLTARIRNKEVPLSD